MSEEQAGFSGFPVAQLVRAQQSLERRGEQLPPAALRVLAREVILRVSRGESTHPQAPTDRPSNAAIELLCDALLSGQDMAAAELVHAERRSGMAADTIYHHYIAEAVRRLGERWERDETSAAQVILGAGRVYAILRDLRAVFLTERLTAPPGAEAVFASVPGEVHGIGATIAADALRRKGWDIALRLGLDHNALVEEIARMQPTMVGLSASLPDKTFAIARLIVALRVRCPQVWVLIGGPIVAHDPEIATLVDADAAAADIETGAALMAAHLAVLNRLARH